MTAVAPAPISNWHQTVETFTVNVCARLVDAFARRWALTIVGVLAGGALLSLRMASKSAISACQILGRLMTTAHHSLPHSRRIAVDHHEISRHAGEFVLVGTRQFVGSLSSHPMQPGAILVGAALIFGAILFALFIRGGTRAGSPQDGDGAFDLVTVGLGLFGFCALVLLLHGIIAAPILTVTHSIVGSVINAA